MKSQSLVKDGGRAFEPIDPLPKWRARKGRSRVVVELPSEVVASAVKTAKRRRIPLAELVERALRSEGVLVALAAIIVGLSGCQPAPEPAPCELPTELPCEL